MQTAPHDTSPASTRATGMRWPCPGDPTVRTSAAEGSFSCTLQVKSAKKKRLKATMTARVRNPREPLEIDAHLDDTGQIALGFGPEPEDDDGEE